MSLHGAPESGAESDMSTSEMHSDHRAQGHLGNVLPEAQSSVESLSSPGGACQHALDTTKTNPTLAQLTEFRYDSQLDQHHIRLLEILPDSTDGIIRCNLETHALAEAPEYNALSYVWGNGVPDKTIICSGGGLKITKSLYAVLFAMRQQRNSDCSVGGQTTANVPTCQLVWIDQICINQEDTDERSQQVRVMQDIYHRATTVLISLGEDFDDLAGPVDRLLAQISDKHADLAFTLYQTRCFPKGAELVRLGLPDLADGSWQALRKMLSLPYFERVWVIQEVIQARKPRIFFKGGVISWKLFLEAMGWLWVWNFSMPNLSLQEPSFSLHQPKIMGIYIGYESSRQAMSTKFYLLARGTRDLESTDPRDKLFALAGIADDGEEVPIDYGKNESEVFEDFARYAIRAERNLNILSDVTHDDQNPGDTPSWVPRWNTPPPCPDPSQGKFNTAGGSEAVIDPQQEPRVLKVKGKEMAFITSKILRFDLDGEKYQVLPEMMSRLVASGFIKPEEEPRDSFVNRIKELAWCLILGSYSLMDETPSGDDADERVLDDFCAFIANGFLLSIRKDNLEAIPAFVQMAGIVFDANIDSLSTKPPRDLGEEALTCFENFKSELQVLCPKHLNDRSSADELVSRVLRAWDSEACLRFERSVIIPGVPRSIFITDEGSMGAGPLNLEEDDIICVLYGGPTPYALRPTSTPDEYTFLGDCYVHGWMHGEALQRSGCKPDKWFRLV